MVPIGDTCKTEKKLRGSFWRFENYGLAAKVVRETICLVSSYRNIFYVRIQVPKQDKIYGIHIGKYCKWKALTVVDTVIVGHGGNAVGMSSHFLVAAPNGDWSEPIVVAVAANIKGKSLAALAKDIVREAMLALEEDDDWNIFCIYSNQDASFFTWKKSFSFFVQV